MTSGAPAFVFRFRGRRPRAGAGDPDAFAALYAKHEQELFRYCRTILGNEEDARDALQNAMVKAFAALQTERRDLVLRPWLFRIAHNEAISLVRRRPVTDELDESLGGAADTVERTVETRERLAHLRTDLQDLPERQRGALVMRELSGLSHEQIGEALGTSARAVKQTLYEARSSLNDCAEGRAMRCDAVQQALSDGDGRISRSRRMRSHLRSCRTCERFRVALVQRPADLAALSPALPLLGATGVAAALKGTSVAGGIAGGTGAAVTAGGGGGLGASIMAAGAAKIAVVASTVAAAGGVAVVAGTQVADREGRTAPTTETSRGSNGRLGAAAGGRTTVGATAARGTGARGTVSGGATTGGTSTAARPGRTAASSAASPAGSGGSAGGASSPGSGAAGGGSSAADGRADAKDRTAEQRAAAKAAASAERRAAKAAAADRRRADKAAAAAARSDAAAARKASAAAARQRRAAQAEARRAAAQAEKDAAAKAKADAAAEAAAEKARRDAAKDAAGAGSGGSGQGGAKKAPGQSKP